MYIFSNYYNVHPLQSIPGNTTGFCPNLQQATHIQKNDSIHALKQQHTLNVLQTAETVHYIHWNVHQLCIYICIFYMWLGMCNQMCISKCGWTTFSFTCRSHLQAPCLIHRHLIWVEMRQCKIDVIWIVKQYYSGRFIVLGKYLPSSLPDQLGNID